jgi:hypothetical protein
LLSGAGWDPYLPNKTGIVKWRGQPVRVWTKEVDPTEVTNEWVRQQLDQTLAAEFGDDDDIPW